MQNGSIAAQGSFTELADNAHLKEVLKIYQNSKRQDNSVEPEGPPEMTLDQEVKDESITDLTCTTNLTD